MFVTALRRRSAILLFAVMTALFGIAVQPGIAAAHTGFDSSVPADGDSVAEPVDTVTLTFLGATTPTDDGFVALDGDGSVRTPDVVDVAEPQVENEQTYVLRFEPPLAGGDVGIRWSVRAADGHTLEGAFSFAVTAALPTTTPTTSPSPATEPVVSEPSSTESASDSSTAVTTEPAASTSTAPAVAASDTEGAAPSGAAAGTVSLDDFLAIDDSRPGETTALIGRVIGLLGVALTLGGIGFFATAWRGPRSEVVRLLTALGVVGVVLAVGALVEYIGVTALLDETVGSAWSTSDGAAPLLRLVGALAIVGGLAITLREGEFAPTRSLSAAVIDDSAVAAPARTGDAPARWRPTSRAWPLAAGAGLILASFWFDGHTVSKGFQPLHAAVNTVHVAAGSIWVGGVVALCATLVLRRRAGHRTGVAELVVRFSKIASVALAAVVAAGVVMAFIVLDSFADLTGTEWGQTLLLKTAAVSVAIAAGAYNNFRLVPALDADPESPILTDRLRSTLVAESVVLLFVVVVTAWLVVAATV